jgi:hypothetical protein
VSWTATSGAPAADRAGQRGRRVLADRAGARVLAALDVPVSRHTALCVLLPCVAVRESVGAGQDRDDADRVQGRLSRPGIHADFPRLRILLKASSARSSAPGGVCRYFSVVAMLPWPRRSFTICKSAPPASSQEACA